MITRGVVLSVSVVPGYGTWTHLGIQSVLVVLGHGIDNHGDSFPCGCHTPGGPVCGGCPVAWDTHKAWGSKLLSPPRVTGEEEEACWNLTLINNCKFAGLGISDSNYHLHEHFSSTAT